MMLGLGLDIAKTAILAGARLPWAGDAHHAWDCISNEARFAGVYRGPVANTPNWTFTRASTGYAQTAAGLLVPFGSGVLRRTDKGVLLEGARTNLLTYSQELDNAAWTKTNVTISANAQTAPDGTLTADTVTATGATGSALRTAAVSSSTVYMASGWLKKGFAQTVRLQNSYDTGGSTTRYGIDIATNGTPSIVVAGGFTTPSNYGVRDCGDYWFCWVGGDSAASNTRGLLFFYPDVAGSSGSATFWGAQLEAGAFPSSPIPTTTTSATRAVDVLTVTSPGVDYPLTLFAEFERVVDTGATENLFGVSTGSNNDRAELNVNSTDSAALFAASGGATQASFTVGAATSVGGVYKFAARFAANDVQGARNGTLGAGDTSVTVPATPTIIRFGSTAAGTVNQFGYLRRAAIFNRALSDAELQAITT